MKRIAWGVVIVAVLSSSVAAVWRARAPSADEGGNAAEIVRVVRRDIETVVKSTGVIKPRIGAEVRVGSRVSGVVKRLLVQVGDAVAQGQLLAELDDHDLAAIRDQASAALKRLEVELAYATTGLRRKRSLHAAGFASDSDLEDAERAQAAAEQQVAGARASLAYATGQVAYTRVTAPIAGVVASVATQEGETVAASFSAPTFLTLLDPSRLEVRTYVDETDIGRVHPGQLARFTVDTYGDHAFDGRVMAIYPQAETRDNVVNYITVVRFEASGTRVLRSEMTTTVRIALEKRDQVLTVPIRAAHWQDGRAYVMARRNGALERRPVKTGSRDDRYLEIVDGLREGDEVLVGDPRQQPGEKT
ncbi:MAG: efflux RND transporter periplasmic adaptor subunit [bacterium]